jgi:hypothetical protein
MIIKKLIFGVMFVGFVYFGAVSPVYPQKSVNINTGREEDTLHYDGPNFTAVGVSMSFYAGVRFTPEVAGTLMAIIFYRYDEAGTLNGNAYVYDEGTPTNPGSIVRIESYSVAGQGWHRIDLSTSYPYNAGIDFWTAIEIIDYPSAYPMGLDSGPAVDGRGDWVSLDGVTWWELQVYGFDNNWNIRAIVHPEAEGVEDEILKQQEKMKLEIYPNPFYQITNIKFQPPNFKTQTTIKIYDATGRFVKLFLLPTSYFSLPTSISWNGTDDSGDKLPPGIYFCYLVSGRNQMVKKVIKLY